MIIRISRSTIGRLVMYIGVFMIFNCSTCGSGGGGGRDPVLCEVVTDCLKLTTVRVSRCAIAPADVQYDIQYEIRNYNWNRAIVATMQRTQYVMVGAGTTIRPYSQTVLVHEILPKASYNSYTSHVFDCAFARPAPEIGEGYWIRNSFSPLKLCFADDSECTILTKPVPVDQANLPNYSCTAECTNEKSNYCFNWDLCQLRPNFYLNRDLSMSYKALKALDPIPDNNLDPKNLFSLFSSPSCERERVQFGHYKFSSRGLTCSTGPYKINNPRYDSVRFIIPGLMEGQFYNKKIPTFRFNEPQYSVIVEMIGVDSVGNSFTHQDQIKEIFHDRTLYMMRTDKGYCFNFQYCSAD